MPKNNKPRFKIDTIIQAERQPKTEEDSPTKPTLIHPHANTISQPPTVIFFNRYPRRKPKSS